MKRCFKCGTDKSESEFYIHPAMADGHLGKCKECAKMDARSNREAHLDTCRAYDRERAKTSKGRASRRETSKAWYKNDPLRMKAHNAIHHGTARGKIQRKSCEICGAIKAHAHHDDYSKPLSVKWLCPVHHKAAHKMQDGA